MITIVFMGNASCRMSTGLIQSLKMEFWSVKQFLIFFEIVRYERMEMQLQPAMGW